MLNNRLLPGIFWIGLLIALTLWAPLWALLPVAIACSVVATRELLAMLEKCGLPAWNGLVLAAAVALPVAGFYHHDVSRLALPVVLPALFMIALFIRQMVPEHDAQGMARIGGSVFAIFYVPLLLSFLPLLMNPGAGRDGRMLAIYLIVVTKMTDMGAYFTGSAIGRTKLIPRISPKKTWEGCIGGLVWSTAASYAFFHFSDGQIGGRTFSLVHVLVIPPVLGVLGILGDLAKSLIKRAAGVKDSGTIFAGMGGMLDVVDSLLFTAPVLYLFVCAFLPPV
jgi:phosphatidate cytidylyltransferase